MTNNTNKATSLEMHWTEVSDTNGRTYMAPQWIVVDHAPAAAHAA